MSKSYLLCAVIGMIGYSVAATLVKLATQSGRFSSYFVLMISSAVVVATSTAITILRGDMKTFSRDNLVSSDGMLVLGAGVALVIAVVFYLLALSEGASQRRRPDLWHVYRWRRRARTSFPARTAQLSQSSRYPPRCRQHLS